MILGPCKLFYLEILLAASAVPIDNVDLSVTLPYILILSSQFENLKETAWLVTKIRNKNKYY